MVSSSNPLANVERPGRHNIVENDRLSDNPMSDATSLARAPSNPDGNDEKLEEKEIPNTFINEMDNSITKRKGPESDETAAVGDMNGYPHGATLFFVLLALAMSIFLASLDMVSSQDISKSIMPLILFCQTIVATAIPKITDEFHGLSKVSWYGSAFFMANAGFQATWGKAYKYFPLKLTFLVSVFVFELGSLICAVSPNSTTLIVGRTINGLGSSGIGTGAYTIIAFVAEPRRRAVYTGLIGISYGVSSVVGPLIGGVFTDKLTWRWCFWINLPIGGVAAAMIFFFFHAPRGAKPVDASWKEKMLQMDLVGAAMIMGALVSLLLALQYGGQTTAWDSSAVIGLLVGFVVILAVFAAWEFFQRERAILPFRLLGKRPVYISALFVFFFCGSYYLTVYYLPIYFQSVDGSSAVVSGMKNLPFIVSVTIAMILSGIFVGCTGLAVATEVCGAAVAVIGAGLLFMLDINTSTAKWIGYQILAGVGWGLGFQVPIIVAQGSASSEDMSSTTAIVLGTLRSSHLT